MEKEISLEEYKEFMYNDGASDLLYILKSIYNSPSNELLAIFGVIDFTDVLMLDAREIINKYEKYYEENQYANKYNAKTIIKIENSYESEPYMELQHNKFLWIDEWVLIKHIPKENPYIQFKIETPTDSEQESNMSKSDILGVDTIMEVVEEELEKAYDVGFYDALKMNNSNLTNGDIIKMLFPNCIVKPPIEYESGINVEIPTDDCHCFILWFPTYWWNTLYKGDMKNGL